MDAGNDDGGDDAADTRLMTAITNELAALSAALRMLLGFDTCDARVSAVLRGDVKGSHDFWLPFPTLKQYYASRLRRATI